MSLRDKKYLINKTEKIVLICFLVLVLGIGVHQAISLHHRAQENANIVMKVAVRPYSTMTGYYFVLRDGGTLSVYEGRSRHRHSTSSTFNTSPFTRPFLSSVYRAYEIQLAEEEYMYLLDIAKELHESGFRSEMVTAFGASIIYAYHNEVFYAISYWTHEGDAGILRHLTDELVRLSPVRLYFHGLGFHTSRCITENMIRAEHMLPLRGAH